MVNIILNANSKTSSKNIRIDKVRQADGSIHGYMGEQRVEASERVYKLYREQEQRRISEPRCHYCGVNRATIFQAEIRIGVGASDILRMCGPCKRGSYGLKDVCPEGATCGHENYCWVFPVSHMSDYLENCHR